MLLEPVQDYLVFLNARYLIGIIAVSAAFALAITYLGRDAKLNKIVLFSVLSITLTPILIGFIFFIFLGYQYVFAQNYEYLQLSVSIFLIFLTLMTVIFINKTVLEREPLNFMLYAMGLIMLGLAGAIFPLVFFLSRIVWTAIS